MARADLLIKLVEAGSSGNQKLFNKTVEAIIAEERAKQHHIVADRLAEKLQPNGNGTGTSLRALSESTLEGVIEEKSPEKSIDDLVLPENILEACSELVEEHYRRDLLRSHNLEPRHKLLLAGPPGNGKTSLAEALAESLAVPLFSVRYESIIGSYLGETATRLRKLFDFVRTYQCVLFFDEFETLAKERGDPHETGEIKRVVSSLLLQMDSLPSHVIVVVASNHPDLLDKATWRRFQLRLLLPSPGKTEIIEWLDKFAESTSLSLGYTHEYIARNLTGLSFAEVEEFGLDVYRKYVLSMPDGNMRNIVKSRLSQWTDRFSPSS